MALFADLIFVVWHWNDFFFFLISNIFCGIHCAPFRIFRIPYRFHWTFLPDVFITNLYVVSNLNMTFKVFLHDDFHHICFSQRLERQGERNMRHIIYLPILCVEFALGTTLSTFVIECIRDIYPHALQVFWPRQMFFLSLALDVHILVSIAKTTILHFSLLTTQTARLINPTNKTLKLGSALFMKIINHDRVHVAACDLF